MKQKEADTDCFYHKEKSLGYKPWEIGQDSKLASVYLLHPRLKHKYLVLEI